MRLSDGARQRLIDGAAIPLVILAGFLLSFDTFWYLSELLGVPDPTPMSPALAVSLVVGMWAKWLFWLGVVWPKRKTGIQR